MGEPWSDEDIGTFDKGLRRMYEEQLSDHDRLQIEQASKGCFSLGTLSHWANMRETLESLSIDMPMNTPAVTVMLLCRLLLKSVEGR